jgi:hypothetical protein
MFGVPEKLVAVAELPEHELEVAALPVHEPELPEQLPVTLPDNAPVKVTAYTFAHLPVLAVPKLYALSEFGLWVPDVMPFVLNARAPLDVMAPQLIVPNPLDPLLLRDTPFTVPQVTLPNPLDPLLLRVTPFTVPHVIVFAPNASAPLDVIAPHVIVFAPNASAPLDVIAPHVIVFAPNPSAPLDVIAPQPNVPIPDTLLPDSVIVLRAVTLSKLVAYTLFHTPVVAAPRLYVLFVAGRWVPDVMPFVLNARAPLDVMAPHPNVPIPDTLVLENVIPLRFVTLDTVGDVTVEA